MPFTRCPASNKSQFHTRRKALLKAGEIWQRDHKIMEVYRCPSCDLWHLTSKISTKG